MLALQSFEQASGFSVLTADELYYVNGGSISIPSPIEMAKQNIQNILPSGIKVTDSGLSAPFGNGDVSISFGGDGVTLSFEIKF